MRKSGEVLGVMVGLLEEGISYLSALDREFVRGGSQTSFTLEKARAPLERGDAGPWPLTRST
jgi:hypothetical protein